MCGARGALSYAALQDGALRSLRLLLYGAGTPSPYDSSIPFLTRTRVEEHFRFQAAKKNGMPLPHLHGGTDITADVGHAPK